MRPLRRKLQPSRPRRRSRTTTMSHRRGQDHRNVTLPWLTRAPKRASSRPGRAGSAHPARRARDRHSRHRDLGVEPGRPAHPGPRQRARGDRRLRATSDGGRAALLRARGARTTNRRPGALRRPLALGRRPGAARAVRRTRPGHRDRARGVQLHRGSRRHPARADHPGGRPVGDPDQARRRQDTDASKRASKRVRPARHHDGAVPVGRPVRPAAGRTPPRWLPRRHPVRGRLPGDLAGRADHPHQTRHPGRHGQTAQALEAHAGAGRPGATNNGHPFAPVPPRPLPRVSQGRTPGQEAAPGHKGQNMTQDPELREPDLPRTAKVRKKALRTGWTTGTCASAAAKAATTALDTGEMLRTVEVGLPSGQRVSFPVDTCTLSEDATQAQAVVVKDAGDDPDVTHGARLTATVRWRGEPGLELDGGVGVGVVTKPGLGLELGGPAINPVPRAMITQAVGEAVDLGTKGVTVIISVPDGERMARKTTNARLGIIGGISILGTGPRHRHPQWAEHSGSFPKSDSGHTGAISITVRACRATWNAMKPPLRSDAVKPGSIASGSGPNFMVNLSRPAGRAVTAASYHLVPEVLE